MQQQYEEEQDAPLPDQESLGEKEAAQENILALLIPFFFGGSDESSQERNDLLHFLIRLPGGVPMLLVFAGILLAALVNILGVGGTIFVAIIVVAFIYARRQAQVSSVGKDIPMEEEQQEQWDLELGEEIKPEERAPAWTLDRLYALTPPEFERIVAKMLERSDYTQVEVVGGSGDLCADIKAIGDEGELVVVQCKRYAAKRRVRSGEVQQFVGMITVHHHANRGIYVTTSSYTKDAWKLGEQNGIEMIDGERLVKIFSYHHCKDISLP